MNNQPTTLTTSEPATKHPRRPRLVLHTCYDNTQSDSYSETRPSEGHRRSLHAPLKQKHRLPGNDQPSFHSRDETNQLVPARASKRECSVHDANPHEGGERGGSKNPASHHTKCSAELKNKKSNKPIYKPYPETNQPSVHGVIRRVGGVG